MAVNNPQQPQIDPASAQGAQIPLQTFTIPSFPPEARSLRALTLTSDINVPTYQDELAKPYVVPSSLPIGIESLTLELFSLGYPPGFLKQLSERLPNLKSVVIYSQLFAGKAAKWLKYNISDVGGEARRGLMFLEVNYTFRHEDEEFMQKIQASELPSLVGPGLISCSFNLAEPEIGDEDGEDPNTIQGTGTKEGIMAFSKTLAEPLVAALTNEGTSPKGLRALNSSLFTLTTEQLTKVLSIQKNAMILSATVEVVPGDEWKQGLLRALKPLKESEQVEIIASPTVQFFMELQDVRSGVLQKTFPTVEDMEALTRTSQKLTSFKATILRAASLGTVEWNKSSAGKWEGSVKPSRKGPFK